MSTEQTVWECGCGTMNGVNLAACARCRRDRWEGERPSLASSSEEASLAAQDVRNDEQATMRAIGAKLRAAGFTDKGDGLLDGVDWLVQRLAEVTHHLTEAQTSGWCDVCCGTGKPTADVPCMCGGTGLAADAVIHLRERLFKVEQRAEAAEATIATLRERVKRLHACAPEGWGRMVKNDQLGPTWVRLDAVSRLLDAALAAPAAGTPQQTKDEDDSTRVDSQS